MYIMYVYMYIILFVVWEGGKCQTSSPGWSPVGNAFGSANEQTSPPQAQSNDRAKGDGFFPESSSLYSHKWQPIWAFHFPGAYECRKFGM